MGINKVILVGNVGKDPEIKHLDKGVSVARFSLATSETYKDKDNKKVTNTEWHNIVLWRGLAEVAEKYVKKGSPLYIEGKIRSRSWDDKDRKKHYATEIVADTMQLLGSKQSSDDNVPVTEDIQNEGNHSIQSEEDDLPF